MNIRLARGLCFAAATLLLGACSGGDDDGDDKIVTPGRDAGTNVIPDAGTTANNDAGSTTDAGPVDCNTNPNGCAMNQSMDGDCNCLDACDNGFVWDPVQRRCDPPPAGECAMDSDCENGEACIDLPMTGGIQPCTGAATCQCLLTCDPFVAFQRSGCPPMLDFGAGEVTVDCAWLGAQNLPEGLCLPENMGGGYGDTCTVMTNGQGQRTGDTCNRNKNFYCLDDNRPGRMGVCSRFCNADRTDDLCADLGAGTERCVGRAFTGLDPNIGWCQTPPSGGLATTCTSSVTCPGGICSAVLQNSCTQACGGIDLCDTGDFCIGFNNAAPGEENICIKGCASPDAAGDAECAALNPPLICRDIFGTGGVSNLCLPSCQLIGCAVMGQVCDPNTGRCM